MSQIVLATYGPPIVVAEEFADIDGAEAVMLFGSWAARQAGRAGHMPNDIDILIVGDADRDAVDLAAERVEQRLGFPTQAVVRTRDQWDEGAESFIRELKARPLYVVLVDERNVGADLFGFAADPALAST